MSSNKETIVANQVLRKEKAQAEKAARVIAQAEQMAEYREMYREKARARE